MKKSPASVLSLTERAAQLPAPQPGQRVTIPFELAPYWLQLHQREITRFDEKRFLYLGQRTTSSPAQETHETS